MKTFLSTTIIIVITQEIMKDSMKAEKKGEL